MIKYDTPAKRVIAGGITAVNDELNRLKAGGRIEGDMNAYVTELQGAYSTALAHINSRGYSIDEARETFGKLYTREELSRMNEKEINRNWPKVSASLRFADGD